MKTVGIVGYGHVGKAIHRLFPDAVVYDINSTHPSYRDEVTKCDVVFVCVPTPSYADGSCDTSIVEEVVGWLDAAVICIKSTVPPGTTDSLARKTGKKVCMSPEFEGETPWQDDASGWPYVICGGYGAEDVLDLYRAVLGPEKAYWGTTAAVAEMTKYMENVWLAMQVTFASEFYDIAKSVGVNYNAARELWALDPRVSRWHTLVFPDRRGFSGKCLPKDLNAILAVAEAKRVDVPMLRGINESNNRLRLEMTDCTFAGEPVDA